MATGDVSTDDFLSGQGVSVDLNDVEGELTRLWGPAAEQVGGPELEHPNVTRIVLANLVVFTRHADAGRLQGVLDTVAAQFPSRAIVLVRDAEPGRAIRAEISALCHLPAPGLPQVCSERIVLRAGPEAVDLLPGAVRPLLEADLPFVLWWTADPREDEALFHDLGDECSRLILDLPDPGADLAALRLGLDPTISQFSRDSAWFGATRWRELVAQFFDPPCGTDAIARIDSVKIDAVVPPGDNSPPRPAVWLASWLAGQLGWTLDEAPTRDPASGRFTVTFRGPTGPVAVEIRAESRPGVDTPGLRSVTLTTRKGDGPDAAEPEVFRLARVNEGSGEVRIDVDSPSHCALPRTVFSPELDAARRISAALESSRNDPPFQKALPFALRLLEG